MAGFLQVIATMYLIVIWLAFAGLFVGSAKLTAVIGIEPQLVTLIALISCIIASIPAVGLFAFGKIVDDVGEIARHVRQAGRDLKSMRAYFEPPAPTSQSFQDNTPRKGSKYDEVARRVSATGNWRAERSR